MAEGEYVVLKASREKLHGVANALGLCVEANQSGKMTSKQRNRVINLLQTFLNDVGLVE